MIKGRVNNDGVPLISITIGQRTWPTIVDSGFHGDLELPLVLQADMKADYAGEVSSVLAGGQIIDQDAFIVDFPFDGEVVKATATFVNAEEILMGTHMLRDYLLEINFPAQSVELRRV